MRLSRLSWSFKGKVDGFQICDEDEVKIGESRNRYHHYFLIKGYGKEKGFVVKAYVDTANGKGHGLGLSRVDAAVKKYGGYVTRASEDGAFSTEILLPQ